MLVDRRGLLALGVWLVCSAVVWNVVFDRGVESAEERYLKAHRAAAPEGGIRAILEPAIEHAAAVATVWATAVFVPGVLLIVFLRRRRRPTSHQPGQAFSP